MKRISLLVIMTLTLFQYSNAQDKPLNAEPGKCYAKCLIADEYETITEQVQTKAAQSVNKVALPRYENITERIMVKPASVRYEPVPAVYETVTEQVLSKEASTRIITIPGEYETVHNSRLYSGDATGMSTDAGDILDPNNPNSPNKANSQFSPGTAGSLSNMNDPNNPYNPESPYYGRNLMQAAAARSGASTGGVDAGFLNEVKAGSILPYIEDEASVSIEKVPANYSTDSETIVVSPASTKWVKKKGDKNCLSADPNDCLVWCLVEVPEQTRTVTKTVYDGCPSGYYASNTRDALDRVECVKVSWKPAKYGVRTIMTKAPEYREEQVPAEYQTVTKRVLKSAATVRKVVVPAEYKSVTRRVRTGLASAGLLHPTGVVFSGKTGGALSNPVQGGNLYIYPMAGYNLDGNYTGEGDPTLGEIDHARLFTATGGVNASGTASSGGAWDAYYTAGCPTGYTFDVVDNLCKKNESSPAQYQTVSKRNLVRKGGMSEWREVVCSGNVTTALVQKVQNALRSQGYDPGVSDNVMGAQTKAALIKFQRDNGLPVGQLDLETLKALGVNQ